MKIHLLKVGMIIKNYKELCKLLEIEVKDGNSKKSQLKELERYVRYHKKGQKFIIDEIYKEVKEKIDERKRRSGGANNTIDYIKNIEKLILDLLSQNKQGYGKVFLSKHMLLKQLKMINGNYAYCKQKVAKLSNFMNIDKATVEEWYDSTNSMLERNLENALKNLEKQSLIFWSREITVAELVPVAKITKDVGHFTKIKKIDEWEEEIIEYKINDKVIINHREGTEEEKRFILHTERELLKEMNCKNKADVIAMGEWEKFIEKVNSIILKKYNLAFYYKSYKIIFTENHVIEALEDEYNFKLNDEEKYFEQNKVNKDVSNRIHNNVIKKQNKAQKEIDKMFEGKIKDEKLIRRTSLNYINDNDKLNNNLIYVNAKDIKDKVKKTKSK